MTNDIKTYNRNLVIEQKFINSSKIPLSSLSTLLKYSEKYPDFLVEQPELFKKAITNALNNPQLHQYLTEINQTKYHMLLFLAIRKMVCKNKKA